MSTLPRTKSPFASLLPSPELRLLLSSDDDTPLLLVPDHLLLLLLHLLSPVFGDSCAESFLSSSAGQSSDREEELDMAEQELVKLNLRGSELTKGRERPGGVRELDRVIRLGSR